MVSGYNYSLLVCTNAAHPLKTYEAMCYIFPCHFVAVSIIATTNRVSHDKMNVTDEVLSIAA